MASAHEGAPAELHGMERSLALYYRALCARSCVFVAYEHDDEEWQRPDTGTSVRLPSHVHVAAELGEDWYRVAVAHRAMHYECGTFDLDLSLPEPYFRPLRPTGRHGDASLERFFASFSRPALAVQVFTTLEDLRVDAVAQRTLPGLRPAYARVRNDALGARPAMAALPPRSAVAEALVRISLGATSVRIAGSLRDPVRLVATAAEPLTSPQATVETVAEATVRAFSVLARLPNLGSAPGPVETVELAGDPTEREYRTFALRTRELRLEGDEVFDVRFAPVRYRDVPGPRYLGHAASGLPLREAILRMTPEATGPVTEEELNSERSQAAEAGLL